jgi:hypothetical protein
MRKFAALLLPTTTRHTPVISPDQEFDSPPLRRVRAAYLRQAASQHRGICVEDTEFVPSLDLGFLRAPPARAARTTGVGLQLEGDDCSRTLIHRYALRLGWSHFRRRFSEGRRRDDLDSVGPIQIHGTWCPRLLRCLFETISSMSTLPRRSVLLLPPYPDGDHVR